MIVAALIRMIEDGIVENYYGPFVVVNVAKLRNQTVKNTRQAFQVVDLRRDQKIIGKFRSVKVAQTAACRMYDSQLIEEMQGCFSIGG